MTERPSLVVNPYQVDRPVRGSTFYGRQDLLKQVQKTLKISNHVVIQGSRRSGKTSFLQHFSVLLQQARSYPPLVPVILDLQQHLTDSLPQFQTHLAAAIAHACEISLPARSPHSAYFQTQWLPQICKHREILILIDDCDALDYDVFPQIPQEIIPWVAQLMSLSPKLKWLFTCKTALSEWDQVFQSSNIFHLKCFSAQEVEILVTLPVKSIFSFESKALEQIYDLTRGHPYLTQALCSELFRFMVGQAREHVAVSDVKAVVQPTLQLYSGPISSLLQDSPLATPIVTAIAFCKLQQQPATPRAINSFLSHHHVQCSSTECLDTLKGLVKQNLLQAHQDQFQLIPLIQLWLIEAKHLTQEIPLTLEPEVPAVKSSPQPHLQITVDGDLTYQSTLTQTRLEIGRSHLCPIWINHSGVSRKHAVLVKTPSGYQILDGDGAGQSSRNGTYVNGHSIKQHSLQSGDVIYFGSATVKGIYRES